MAESMMLKAEKRVASGSAAARRLRAAGKIPAEFYGGEMNRSIQLNAHSFNLMLKRHGEHLVMDLEVDDETAGKVLIKSVQHDPVNGSILHADLTAVSMDKLIEIALPLNLIGEAAGVKLGGILEQQLGELEVSCLPGDMVEEIPVDVSALAVGDHLCVSDIALPAGLTAVTDADVVVASVQLPGAEKSDVSEAEKAEEASKEAAVAPKAND